MADLTPPSQRAVLDEWLVVRCQLGEREAFDALIAEWHPQLWRYAVRFTNDPEAAADTVQDVWLGVIRGLARLRDPGRFRPWVYGIARRVLMDRLRVRYRDPIVEPLDDLDVASASDEPDPEDDLAALEIELAGLPLLEREVLALFYLQELSLAEIADVTSIPIGTVKSRLFRARRLLRQQMEARGVRP